MVMAGYSPSVRLFEAAACGATIISDNWPGLETFLSPNEQILVPTGAEDVVRYLSELSDSEVRRIGNRAQERALSEHTSERRATDFEKALEQVSSSTSETRKELPVAIGSP
jgi:spore maturation protein CgeB